MLLRLHVNILDVVIHYKQTKRKKIKTDENVIHIKDELKDIKPNGGVIEEELHAMFDIDERLSIHDPNMYNSAFSPISITSSIGTQTKQAYVPEYYDDDYNVMIKENFQNIFGIVEYLKQDIIMN
jgi:hypothetical protein